MKLSDGSKLFLRAMFIDLPGEKTDDTIDRVAQGGRKTIQAAIEIFVQQFEEDIPAQEMERDAANIRSNMDEAVAYVGGLLGMC